MADLQTVCELLEQIRDALHGRHAGEQCALPVQADVDGADADPVGLRIDLSARLAFWNGRRLSINSHADFSVLACLAEGAGSLVSYQDLERAISPGSLGQTIGRQFDAIAPQDVKDAVQHIRHAFREVSCPLRVENVRQKGYRLHSPTNNLPSSTSTTSTRPPNAIEGAL